MQERIAMCVRQLPGDQQDALLEQIERHAVLADRGRLMIPAQTGNASACRQPFERNVGNLCDRDQIRRTRRCSIPPLPLHRRTGADADSARQLRPAQAQRFPCPPDAFPQGWRGMMDSSNSSLHTTELLIDSRATDILSPNR